MRNSSWVFALLLLFVITSITPASAHAKRCHCPCPQTRHRNKASVRSVPEGKRSVSIPIAGGKSADHPVPIEFGRIYKINHPQKKGVKDYFSLSLDPGTELSIAMKSLGTDPKAPRTGLELLDLRGQQVATLTIDGEENQVKSTTFRPFKTGRYVIAVGSSEASIGKNQVFFKTLVAPATIDCALNGDAPIPISIDAPREDCFWKENGKDLFHFDVKRKGAFRVEVVFGDGTSAGLRARVGIDRRKKSPKILTDVSSTGDRVTIESIVLPKRKGYTLEVELLQPLPDIIPYTVKITPI